MGFDFDLVMILEMSNNSKRCISLLLTLLSWEPFGAI